jgi:hypothetical protein
MSRLAGFDLCIEISRSALRRLFIKYATIGGTSPNPPFDFSTAATLPKSQLRRRLGLFLPIESLELSLWSPAPRVTVGLGFTNGVVQGAGISATDLAGTLNVDADIDFAFTQLFQTMGAVRINLSTATATLHFDRASAQQLTGAIGASGGALTLDEVRVALEQACTSTVRNGQSPAFPQKDAFVGMPVNPNIDGRVSDPVASMYQGPILVSLDAVMCPTPDAVAVFGTFLLSSSGGNASTKTGTCLAPGADLAITISSEVFRRLSFCLAAIKAIRKPNLDTENDAGLKAAAASDLPSSCGAAKSIEYKKVEITSLRAELVDPSVNAAGSVDPGHIDVSGSYHKMGFCYDAHGVFTERVDLKVDGTGALTAQPSPPWISKHLSAPWYCPTAPLFVLGELNPIVATILDELLQIQLIILRGIGVDVPATTASIPSPKPAFFGVIDGAKPTSVETYAEGISVNAAWTIDLPTATARTIELVGQTLRAPDQPKEGASGVYVMPDGMLCQGGSFPWTEFTATLQSTYELRLSGWQDPVTVEWLLEHLKGRWGYNQQPVVTSAAILDVTPGTHWATIRADLTFLAPPPAGLTLYDQLLWVMYEIKGRTIDVTSNPSKGNYSLNLRARVSDATGASMETSVALPFHGEWVEFRGGYREHVSECMSHLRDWMRRHGTVPQTVPHDGDPGPEGLVAMIARAREIGGSEGHEVQQEIIRTGSATFGKRFQELLSASGMR